MNPKNNFKIGKKIIGEDNKCLIIAEISANHNNNFDTIKRLINSAKESGADIIKIQTYTADTLTIESDKKDFQIKKRNPWSRNKNLWNLYKKAETSEKLTTKIFKYSRSIDMEIFSSPFDIGAVDFLEKINCPAYKIASPEINHIPLIERVARTQKPIILSLGLASIMIVFYAGATISNIIQFRIMPLEKPGLWFLIMQFTRIFIIYLVWIQPEWWVLMAVLFVWGLNMGVTTNLSRAIIQEGTEPAYLARVLSVYSLAIMGSMPVGALIIGFIIEGFGTMNAMVPAIFVSAALCIYGFAFTDLWKYTSPSLKSD